MKSTIVRGQLFHKRFFPVSHQFRYPLYFYCLNLSELEILDRNFPGFGHNRFGITSIHDQDYLDEGNGSIQEKLFGFLGRAGIRSDIQQVMMVTSPRFMFSVFNPVTFYFCRTDANVLECAVAEVHNTFGENHLYILTRDMKADSSGLRYTTPKAFHVSPFNRVEGTYDFYFGPLDQGIDIRITLQVAGRKKFTARLWGDHYPFTLKNHARFWLRHPLVPHRTMTRILKEAGVLYFGKKLPYVQKPVDTDPMTIRKRPSNRIQKLSMALFLRSLKRIKNGRLNLTLPDGRRFGYGSFESNRKVEMTILEYDFFPRVILGGDIGFGEAYMLGFFRTDDLTALLEIFIRDLRKTSGPGRLPAFFNSALAGMVRAGEKNNPLGSRRNIRRHYDLSNDFFRLFLDRSMTYSCALFQSADDSLETAQENKLSSIIEKARITADDHVLEIGSGWGSFAVAAVRKTGCQVTTITLSMRQFTHVSGLIKDLGLEDRITVLMKDYRAMTGRFDRIVSIEMLEAVGHRYLGTFFSCCHRLLKPDGRMVLQVITLPDQEYAAYRLRLDWIQKHIFPGGHLPSLTALCTAMTRKSPFIIEHLENIGPHYAETLKRWHRRFADHLDQVRELGYDGIFILKWDFYLRSCEAMFRQRGLENLQLVVTRPYGKERF